MDNQIKEAISLVKELFHSLVLSGLRTVEAVEVLFADGSTPLQLAYLFSDGTEKKESVRRSSLRLKQRILSQPFSALKDGVFVVDFSSFATKLSIYNNNINNNQTEHQTTVSHKVTKKCKTVPSQAKTKTSPSISSEVVEDAKYMVELLGGKFPSFGPDEALTALLSAFQHKTYDSELARKAIEQAYSQIESIKTNPGGYVKAIIEYRLKTKMVFFGEIQRRKYSPQGTSKRQKGPSKKVPHYIWLQAEEDKKREREREERERNTPVNLEEVRLLIESLG